MLTEQDLMELGKELFPKAPEDKIIDTIRLILILHPEITNEDKEQMRIIGKELLKSSYFKRQILKNRNKSK